MFVIRMKFGEAKFLSNLRALPDAFIEHLSDMLDWRDQDAWGNCLPALELFRHACNPVGTSRAGNPSRVESGSTARAPSVAERSTRYSRFHLAIVPGQDARGNGLVIGTD